MVTSILKKEAENLILSVLSGLSGTASAPSNINEKTSILSQIVYPPETKLGHVAFPCYSLSKQLRKAPQQIASEVAAALQTQGTHPWFSRVEASGGYLNFFADPEMLFNTLASRMKSGQMLVRKPDSSHQKVMVEYAQLNTHKAYHVGHLRNIVFGDCIANLVEASGKPVVRVVYPGDIGTHIAKVLWYIHRFKKDQVPSQHQAEWLGDMYSEADAYLKSLADTPQEKEVKAEMGALLRELEDKKGPLMDFYKTSREWSLNLMKEILDWLGIHFDEWYFESECDRPSRELVLKKYAEGFFVKSDGAIGIDLSPYGLGFALFLKSDGTTLYLTKDLELIRRKFSNPEIGLSIVVVDTRQTLHFRQVFKTAELMGLRPESNSVHLSYETVTDENGEPCSSRSNTGFRLEVLSQMICQKIIDKYLSSYRGTWTEVEIQSTARKIALGALKYGFLKVDSNRIIRFVLDDWIQLEGDTGPYIQYVHARCCGVSQKVERAQNVQDLELATEYDRELLLMLERFTDAVQHSSKEYRPSVLCSYLYDLCKVFNRFYKECPIKSADTPAQKNTRLTLVEMTAATIREGLAILGIPAPERL